MMYKLVVDLITNSKKINVCSVFLNVSTYIILKDDSEPHIETHLHTQVFAVCLHQTSMMVLVCLSAMFLELDDHNLCTTLLLSGAV